jgi:hypothetical protein
MEAESDIADGNSRIRTPLVFISHDTRDAALAEAFSRLLSSVSAGVLKSFRSSDKKGNQGIEYGVEWYPEIMKKLEAASDVVCLLTPNSVGRPWILYEAGVAKGKLETPVHGVALGIPLQNASIGPFAQFQNSDDSEDALTQLVMQLVGRIPNSEPDREVVRTQVAAFREKALPMVIAHEGDPTTSAETDTASVAKIFEEVKVMFQDLPGRIERRLDPDFPPNMKRRRRISPRMMSEMMHVAARELPDGLQLVVIASQFRDDFPWLYELAVDAYRRLSAKEPNAVETLSALEHLFHITLRHPLFRELGFRSSKERYFEMDEMMSFMHETIGRLRDRNSPRILKSAEASILQVDDAEGDE